jgi:hypothetical protein
VKCLRANDNKLLCSDLREHGSVRWQHCVVIVTKVRVWKGDGSEVTFSGEFELRVVVTHVSGSDLVRNS